MTEQEKKYPPFRITKEQAEKLEEDEFRLVTSFARMNSEGQKKLLDYADDLISSGKYRK